MPGRSTTCAGVDPVPRSEIERQSRSTSLIHGLCLSSPLVYNPITSSESFLTSLHFARGRRAAIGTRYAFWALAPKQAPKMHENAYQVAAHAGLLGMWVSK